MANLKMEKVAAIPAGSYRGIITRCHIVKKTFDRTVGPVDRVEITIQPDWKHEGHRTLPVSCVMGATLNSLSGLGRLLARLERTPADGADFVPESIEGTEVEFTAVREDDFTNVEKDSIRKAGPRPTAPPTPATA